MFGVRIGKVALNTHLAALVFNKSIASLPVYFEDNPLNIQQFRFNYLISLLSAKNISLLYFVKQSLENF
jgi:hypothetical protein